MFNHPNIQICKFEDIPLDCDISLMDAKWMEEYEAALVASVSEVGASAHTVGYHSRAAARAIGTDFIELSWYPNTHDRFHEVRIILPHSAFVNCVASRQYDYNPVVFVDGNWLTNQHLRSHSIFALVDAVNVKSALVSGLLTHSRLIELRDRIDTIAAANSWVAFISFAGSLLLKSNYSVGQYNSGVRYTYEPERILRLLPDIQAAYHEVLGLGIYAVITQGSNEYYDNELLHIAASRNHVSFNSLGLPFAQTQAIQHAARDAIRASRHQPTDAYLDEAFFHSLRFRLGFDKHAVSKFRYDAPMVTGPTSYFPVSFNLLAEKLEPSR